MSRFGLAASVLLAALGMAAGGCSDSEKAESPGDPAPAQAPTAGPEKITVSHILVGFKGPSLPKVTRSEAQALELVKSIMGDLTAKRRTFEELALAFSDDGDDGVLHTNNKIPGSYTMGHGDMVPEFEKTAFATPIGQVAPEPVKTKYGYHIIRRDK